MTSRGTAVRKITAQGKEQTYKANCSEGDGLSFISVDDLEPRPTPRVNRFPAPFDFPEKPRPIVPDVSLIVDSSFKSNFTTSNNKSTSSIRQLEIPLDTTKISVGTNLISNQQSLENKPPDPSPSNIPDEGDGRTMMNIGLVEQLISVNEALKQQNMSISNIEDKLAKLLDFQEMFSSYICKKDVVSTAVQTETQSTPAAISIKKTSSSSRKNSMSNTNASHENSNLENKSRTSLPIHNRTELKRNISKSNPHAQNSVLQHHNHYQFHQKVKNGIVSKDEFLSAFLKDVQLPRENEPSMFSEMAPIKSVDLQEFDDSFHSSSDSASPILGASASEYNKPSASKSQSSFSDICDNPHDVSSVVKVKPSATFYKKVLGNVDRLLESDRNNENRLNASQETENSQSYINKDKILSERKNQSDDGARDRSCKRPSFSDSLSFSSNSSSDVFKSNTKKFYPITTPNNEEKENINREENKGDEVVKATKKYLETIGVRLNSSSKPLLPTNHNRNYMIQQNVYNSIYIPTVNCASMVPEAIESNTGGTGGSHFHSLAKKYAHPEDVRQYEALTGDQESTEVTVYGMTPSNLSFATKEYLQRYGLVNHQNQNLTNNVPIQRNPCEQYAIQHPGFRRVKSANDEYDAARNDRILDITAIRNQPTLL